MIYDKDLNWRLRLIDQNDINFLLELRSDPEIINNLSSFIFLNQKIQESWIMNIDKAADKKYLIFEKSSDDDWKKIGLVRIDCIDFINRSMRVGGDIHSNYRGQGFSKIMYTLIFELGFNTWNFNRLWLFLLESNTKAFNLYQKMGFQKEGIQKQAVFKNGVYLDHIMMSLLKTDHNNLFKE